MRWLTLPLLFCACDTSEVSDGVGQELVSFSGCDDIQLHARNDADTIALFVTLPPGLIDEARDQGGGTSFQYDLPAREVVVRLEEGQELTSFACSDNVDSDGSSFEIDRAWVARSGSVEGEVTATGEPEPGNNPATVTVELIDVVLASDGDSVQLGPVTFDGILVGWSPLDS